MENTEKKQYVNSISITLGTVSQCSIIYVGQTPLFIHASPDELRALAASINEAADRLESK